MDDYLKAKNLLAVPFDRSCLFCLKKNSTYIEKFDDMMLNSDHVQKINKAKDESVINKEKQTNKSPK